MAIENYGVLESGWFGFKEGLFRFFSPVLPNSLEPSSSGIHLNSAAQLVGALAGIIFAGLATITLFVGALLGISLLSPTAGAVFSIAVIIGVIFLAGMKYSEMNRPSFPIYDFVYN